MKQRRHSAATVAVLLTLLEQTGEVHGYGLTTGTGLVSGSLYPILARLESRNLVSSRWDPGPVAGRPARKLYQLTEDGVTEAERVLADERMRIEFEEERLPT